MLIKPHLSTSAYIPAIQNIKTTHNVLLMLLLIWVSLVVSRSLHGSDLV